MRRNSKIDKALWVLCRRVSTARTAYMLFTSLLTLEESVKRILLSRKTLRLVQKYAVYELAHSGRIRKTDSSIEKNCEEDRRMTVTILQEIVEPLLAWYQKNARVLPWRQDPSPYHVWLSEIMLQQTRVEAVKEYYRRFLDALPTVQDLAEVEEDQLLKLWQGLGYYNRARNLQKAAQVICTEYGGNFPSEYEQWLDLPGVGEYTAGAVVSMAFGRKKPAVDGNVYRIYTRLQADGTDITKTDFKRRVRQEIQDIMPENPGQFNQAWMDLGATVCLPNGAPLCDSCPLSEICRSHQEGTELSYPVKPVKKPRRIEERTVFLLEYQGKYLIQKRPDKGLLAGLWEFPAQEGYLTPEQVSAGIQDLGVLCMDDSAGIELLGRAKHVFSHVEWHMLGYAVHLSAITDQLRDTGVFSSAEELRDIYSIPSAFSYYLEYLINPVTSSGDNEKKF